MTDASRARRRGGPGRVALALALLLAIAAPLAGAADEPVMYGDALPLNGRVPSGQAGQGVDILAREYGQNGFGRIASVISRSGGRWSHVARPRIFTTYVATTTGSLTSQIDVQVSPRLDLDLRRGILSVSAKTLNTLRGHYVLVQVRRPGGTWHGVRKIGLGPGARASIPFQAPVGGGATSGSSCPRARRATATTAASAASSCSATPHRLRAATLPPALADLPLGSTGTTSTPCGGTCRAASSACPP